MMNPLARFRSSNVRRFSSKSRGANLVEYLILVGCVACVALAVVTQFGGSVKNKINDEKGKVDSVPTG